MTHLNLDEASLLDISGELSSKTRAKLHRYMDRHPIAKAEHESLRGQFAALRSLPTVELSAAQKRSIGDSLKANIHQKVRNDQRQVVIRSRWRSASHALAGALALAACWGIAVTIHSAFTSADKSGQAAVAKAEQTVRDFINSDSPNLTDYTYNRVESDINAAQVSQNIASTVVPINAMIMLSDDQDNSDPDAPFFEPNAL